MNRNNSDSNDDSGKYRPNFTREADHGESNENIKGENTQESERAKEYVRELLAERLKLDEEIMPKIARIVEQEITKNMTKNVPKYVNIYREKPIKVSVKVLIPVKEHPKFNFVGKLLGPKGNTLKRLQEETMCKMSVLGKGSMKDPQKEEGLKATLDPKYSHLFDDLHVDISAYGPPAEAHARIAFALAEVRKYLIPDNNDSIRQEQLRELESISGGPAPGMNKFRDPSRRPGIIRDEYRAPIPRPPTMMRTATRLPVDTRVMPAKTKIMSILDRVRMAMEDGPEEAYEVDPSYGGYDAPPRSYGTYDAPISPSYMHPSQGEYQPDFYRKGPSGDYGETSHHRWKNFKSSNPNVMPSRHGDNPRYRPSPYSRPMK